MSEDKYCVEQAVEFSPTGALSVPSKAVSRSFVFSSEKATLLSG
jgi:hypothetical protein